MLAFLYYYLPSFRPLFLIYYLRGIGGSLRKLGFVEIILIPLITIIFLVKLKFGIKPSLLWIRLFFGLWFVSYLPSKYFQSLDKFAPLLAVWTVLEYFLFHLSPSIVGAWPNYINSEGAIENVGFSGLFAGPYSWGGNRTVTGVVSLALMINEKYFFRRLLFLLSTILSFSTTAFMLLIVYLIFTNLRLIFLTAPIFLFIWKQVDFGYRLSSDYVLKILFEYKFTQLQDALAILTDNFIFGNGNIDSQNISVANYGLYFGDFMILDLLCITGIFGFITFIFIIVSKMTKNNWVAILILFIGSFHYHVLFSLPGQLVFGMLAHNSKISKINNN